MAEMSSPIAMDAAGDGGDGAADPAALMTAETDQLAGSSGSPSSTPEAPSHEEPPLTPEKAAADEAIFGSAVYCGLGEQWAAPEDKVAAGYRLIDAQKKDIDRMNSRLTDIQNQLREKEGSVAQLYSMIEKVSPVLKQMSGWNTKLTEEQAQLQEELRKVQKALGIEQTDVGDSCSAPVPAEEPSSAASDKAQ